MATNAPQTLKTASVLAFERKLDPSDALLFAGDWNARDASQNWEAITLREKAVRGTISNRLKTRDQDPARLDAAIENPNLQTVDIATLPADADTLKVRFTLRVHGNVGKPCTCNDAAYGAKLAKNIEKYVQTNGFSELARRYALNLANGRFLWRNRIGAEQVEIHIAQLQDGKPAASWIFNALEISLRDMSAPATQSKNISEIARTIVSGLSGDSQVLFQITAFVRMGAGQEVFPSQELILGDGKNRGSKSKTLYDVNGTAALHSQKIGNAIRTIDTWYTGAEENGPIAVEPYGSVTTQGKAWRQPILGMDFYNLLDNWILRNNVPNLEQQHFVVATLIRGGVFGEAN